MDKKFDQTMETPSKNKLYFTLFYIGDFFHIAYLKIKTIYENFSRSIEIEITFLIMTNNLICFNLM